MPVHRPTESLIGQSIEMVADQTMNSSAGGDYFIGALGNYSASALGDAYLNGTFVLLGESLVAPSLGHPLSVTAPQVPTPNLVATYSGKIGPDTANAAALGASPPTVPYLTDVVPQHEPWAEHSGNNRRAIHTAMFDPQTLSGGGGSYNGYTGGSSTGGRTGPAPPGITGASFNTNPVPGVNTIPAGNYNLTPGGETLYRRGATDPAATAPLNFVGLNMGSPGMWQGVPYSTTSPVEAPQYTLVGPATLHPASYWLAQGISDDIVKFLISKEGNDTTVYPDPGNGVMNIGIGHNCILGEQIGSYTVTQQMFDTFRTGNKQARSQIMQISKQDGLNLLKQKDFYRYSASVVSSIHADMSQGQFNALMLLSFSIGGIDRKSGLVAAFNAGDSVGAMDRYLEYRKVVNNDPTFAEMMRNRRIDEVRRFWLAGAPPAIASSVPT